MEALKAIFTRRSIRKFTAQAVSEEDIEQIMKAASVAPSAADQRPWHFVVIRDTALLRKLSGAMAKCDMLDTATLGILVCGDESLEKIPGYWVQDCSACAENILLAAHALGLGAVWIAIHPIPDRFNPCRKILGVPDKIMPFALIAAGHPDEKLPGEERLDPSRIHNNVW
ncbi:MAG: nitroreductase family protein [Kiritimatiellia bacterium]